VSEPISGEALARVFAAAPWVIGAIIFLVAYLMVRGRISEPVPIGQTFACAGCGRRGHRDHMLPATHEGAVTWYCAKCTDNH
jgi:hypothetical protein